jgi:molybdate transport system permease protein
VRRPAPFTVACALAFVAAAAFLVLPLVAIFVHVPPARLARQLTSPVVVDALRVTLETNVLALALVLLLGTPAAYLLATRRFRGRALAVTLLEVPLVLPPAVAGIALLVAFGRFGLLGGALGAVGVHVALTKAAVVLAVAFVASPFYVRGAIAAFETVDPALLDAARSLGARPAQAFARVALPLALPGLGAAAAVAFARGVGEFGATLMFAGSLRGVTQTLSLAIYAEFAVDLDVALAISALLVLLSAVVLLLLKLLPAWTRSASTSRPLYAASASS